MRGSSEVPKTEDPAAVPDWQSSLPQPIIWKDNEYNRGKRGSNMNYKVKKNPFSWSKDSPLMMEIFETQLLLIFS